MSIFSFGPSKKNLKKQILDLENKNKALELENIEIKGKFSSIKFSKDETQYLDLKNEIKNLNDYKEILNNEINSNKEKLYNLTKEIEDKNNYYSSLIEEYNIKIQDLEARIDKESSNLNNISKNKKKINLAFKSVEYALKEYYDYYTSDPKLRKITIDKESSELIELINRLDPSVSLKTHSMDVKELKKSLKLVQETIEDTLQKYENRYTTKANIAIYKLMVIALKAELQNILYNLKYGTLEESLNLIKLTTKKYLDIATNGNQSIAPTLTKFIGEIEYLFLKCVKIEYKYYVKKEQQKAEQAALREQIKQEAAEKKELALQRKKVEAEETKYKNEIFKIQEQLSQSCESEKEKQLRLKIDELQRQLDLVESKKEDIVNRQNGKAGNVYIISNLGSFGKDVFKIGMTRRLDPFERIKELGSASVPFTFDIHSFIFSDDAVALEQKLHSILNEKRVNKINLRKEFFKVSIDELEKIVYEIDSSAEFNKTMLAEEYNQSVSLTNKAYNI